MFLTASNRDSHHRSLYALLAAMVLLLAGNGLLETSVSYRSALLSQSATVTSWIMACYYLGFLAGSWHMPVLLRRLSHRTVFVILAPCLAMAIFGSSLHHAPTTVALLQLCCGLCISGLYVVAESYINSRCDDEVRARYFSYYMLTWYLGVGFGQFPLLVDSGFNSYLFNIATLFVLISLVPVGLMGKQETAAFATDFKNTSAENTRFRQLFSSYPIAFCVSLLSGVMIGIFFGMGPAFGEQHFSSSQQTASMITAFVLGAGLTQMPLAKLCNRLGPESLLIALALSGIVMTCCAILFFDQLSVLLLLLLSLMLGACALPLYTIATMLIQIQITDKSRITASALLLLCNGLGSIIGPLMAGQMMAFLGNIGFYGSLILCFIVLLAISLQTTTSKTTLFLASQQKH